MLVAFWLLMLSCTRLGSRAPYKMSFKADEMHRRMATACHSNSLTWRVASPNGPNKTYSIGHRWDQWQVLVEGLLATGMKVSQVAECCRVVAAVALLSDPELGSDLRASLAMACHGLKPSKCSKHDSDSGDQSLPVSAKLLRLEEPELLGGDLEDS